MSAEGKRLPLSDFQHDEVSGLLDIVEDEISMGTDTILWGRLEGRSLAVLDAPQAAEELNRRATYLVEEGAAAVGPGVGVSGATSLRKLAAKIEMLPALAKAEPSDKREQTPR